MKMPYEVIAGQTIIVYLLDNKICSMSPKVALCFAIDNVKPNQTSVLFVISCQNYKSPCSIRMTNKAHLVCPLEDEFLLIKGTGIVILSVQRNYLIKNEYKRIHVNADL